MKQKLIWVIGFDQTGHRLIDFLDETVWVVMEKTVLKDHFVDSWRLFVETYEKHVIFTVETYLNRKLLLLDVHLKKFKPIITLQTE